jgi:hypothetical protein
MTTTCKLLLEKEKQTHGIQPTKLGIGASRGEYPVLLLGKLGVIVVLGFVHNVILWAHIVD